MIVGPGEHEIGPPSATLQLRTCRQGFVAKAGHGLVFEAAAWNGAVVVPGESGGIPSVTVEIDLGGIKPCTGFPGALELRDAVDVDVSVPAPG